MAVTTSTKTHRISTFRLTEEDAFIIMLVCAKLIRVASLKIGAVDA